MSTEQPFQLSAELKAQILVHVDMGRDCRDTYALLWPEGAPVPYTDFLALHAAFIVEWLGSSAQSVRVKGSAEERELRDGLVEMARGLREAFQDCLGTTDMEDPLAKFHVLPKLASAYRAMLHELRGQRRQELDDAATVHNLLASSQRDSE